MRTLLVLEPLDPLTLVSVGLDLTVLLFTFVLVFPLPFLVLVLILVLSFLTLVDVWTGLVLVLVFLTTLELVAKLTLPGCEVTTGGGEALGLLADRDGWPGVTVTVTVWTLYRRSNEAGERNGRRWGRGDAIAPGRADYYPQMGCGNPRRPNRWRRKCTRD